MLGVNHSVRSPNKAGTDSLIRDYDFIRKDKLHQDIEFSRASNATQVGSDGYIKYAPHNLWKYSVGLYDGWSEQTSGAFTKTQNATTSPSGETDATLLKTTVQSGLHIYKHSGATPTVVAGSTICNSVYMKQESTRYGRIYHNDSNSMVLVVDLQEGVVVSTGLINGSYGLIDAGDGWWRVWYTHTLPSTHAMSLTYISPTNEAGSISHSGNEWGIYIWGAQLEFVFDKTAGPSELQRTTGTAYNGPRFDYSADGYGNSKGLLIEEARTNLLPYSQDFSNAQWVNGNTIKSLASNITDPSGGNNSYKVTQTTNPWDALNEFNLNLSTNTAHTFSVFIKKPIDGQTSLRIYDSENEAAVGTVFHHWADGVPFKTDATVGTAATPEDYGNGWYRLSITGTTDASDASNNYVQIMPDYDDTGEHCFVWGAQLEQGSFPTSLIPTYGATADRAADIVNVTGAAFSRFFKQTEGTIVVDAQVAKGFDDATTYARIYSFNDNSSSDSIRSYISSSNRIVGSVKQGSDQANNTATSPDFDDDDGGVFKFGHSYKTNRSAVFGNGVAGGVGSDVTVTTNLTQLNIGNRYNGTNPFNGWIRRFRYFNKAKADAQVLNLTDSSKLLDRYRGAKAAHSLRSLRDGRDSSPVCSVRRSYDNSEKSFLASEVSDGTLENFHKSEAQKTLPLDVSCEADEMIVGGDFTDLVTNGDFATDSDWTKGTGVTISSGKANFSNAPYVALYQNIGQQSGQVTVTFDVTDYTSGTLNVYSGGNQSAGNVNVSASATGSFSAVVDRAGGNNNIIFGSTNNFTGSIDNVSVVEGSWTLGTGWAISGGVATHEGSVGNLALGTTLKANKQYVVTLDVLTLADQTCNVYDTGTGTTYGNFASVGSHSLTFTKVGTAALAFRTSSSNCVIDNASLKEVVNSNSATGFSTRLINSDYKGKPLMRIRNQSNLEAELYADANNEISLSSSIKGSSQNLVLFSEDFSNAAWNKNLGNISSGVSDPNGGTNASKFTPTTGSGFHYFEDTFTVVSGKTYTYSIHVKADGYNFLMLNAPAGNAAGNAGPIFNLETGQKDGFLATDHELQVEQLDDGWYRISTQYTTNGTSLRIDHNVLPTNSVSSYSGNGTSGILFWGAQLEETQYASSGSNILYNGDFELDTFWDSFGSPVTQTQSTEQVRSGTYSRKITSTATSKGIQSSQGSEGLDLTKGNKYRISAWIYAVDGGGDAGVQSGLGNTDQSVFTNRPVTQGQWTNITYDAIATASGKVATYLSFFTTGDTRTFYVDDVTVTELPVESPSTYSQTPVKVSTHHSTDAVTLGEFSGLENLITYSEGAFASNWGNAATATDNTHPNPIDGALTASTLKSTSGIQHRTISVAIPTAGSYVFSVYLKKKTGSASVGIGDFTDGTVTQTVTDEWQRFSKTTTFSAGTHTFTIRVGDTDEEVFVWGAQVNSNSLKTYQKTSGTALTGDVNVVNWYCQNGNEDFVNDTAVYQPRIVMGSELVTDSGGKASVYFDGNDNLINATLAGQNRLDSYIVIEPDLAADDSQVLLSGNDSSKYGLIFDDGNSSQTINNGIGTPTEFINGTQLAASATRNDVHDGLKGPSLFSLTDATTSSFTTFQMGWNNSSGSTLNYQGKLSEMVFFPNMDSSIKRFEIESNITRHHDLNLVRNGTFDDDISSWTQMAGATISYQNGTIKVQTTNYIGAQQFVTVAPYSTYRITFDVVSTTTSTGRIYIGTSSDKDAYGNHNGLAVGTHTFDVTTINNSSLQLRLSTTDASGNVNFDNVKVQEYGTDGFVTTLYDQSGNNNHALQSTAANQPQLVSGGDLIKSGGHPAWEHTDQSNLELHGKLEVAHLDAWFVADTSDNQYLYPSTANDYNARFGFVAHDGSSAYPTSGYGGSSVDLYANGSLIGSGAGTTRDEVHTALNGRKLVHHQDAALTGWSQLQMGLYTSYGNDFNYEGKFSEWIWYDSDQSGNKTGIESNINDHYNIYS